MPPDELTEPGIEEVSRWMDIQAVLDEVFTACEGPAEMDLQVARDALVQSAAAHVKAIQKIDALLKEHDAAAS